MAKTIDKAVKWDYSEDKVRVQVSVADHANYDVLKRSRRVRAVGQGFQAQSGKSDFTIFETTEKVLKDLKLKIGQASETISKEKVERSPRRRVDHSQVEASALRQVGLFNASVVVKETQASLPLVRQILGAMVHAGRLTSIPKKGYQVV
jgi:hypothetical protein